jgi:hypothetical protein
VGLAHPNGPCCHWCGSGSPTRRLRRRAGGGVESELGRGRHGYKPQTPHKRVHSPGEPIRQTHTGGVISPPRPPDYSANTNGFRSASQDMSDASHYGTVIAYGTD